MLSITIITRTANFNKKTTIILLKFNIYKFVYHIIIYGGARV